MPLTIRDFEGDWRIEREIDDRTFHGTGMLQGTASFTRNGEALHYLESGILRFATEPPMTTRRCYRWIKTESGADVQFDDGRPFHSVDLSRTRPQASHDCPPDRYDVTYDFGQWPVWSLHWIVKGPRKDYSMTTWFRRG